MSGTKSVAVYKKKFSRSPDLVDKLLSYKDVSGLAKVY